MRRTLIACLLLASSQAVAGPPTWADWVGEYSGSVRWRGCTAPGEKSATVAFQAVDGATRIDLAPLGAALRAMSLTQEDKAWVAQDGDLGVRVSRKKANTIELAIDYDSGCTARGQLVRASTGVPACDSLVAWARIEQACTKVTSKLEGDLAKQKWKKQDAAACTARADKLEHAMIDAGCAPHPDPEIAHRAPACIALTVATQKLAACGRVPHEIMQRLSRTASSLSAAAQSAERATLPYVERQCKDARLEVAGTAAQFQCQL